MCVGEIKGATKNSQLFDGNAPRDANMSGLAIASKNDF